MFLGHYAAALAAKALAPRTSLGTLTFAAVFADLAFAMLFLAGVETMRVQPLVTGIMPYVFDYYPISHSLAALAVWGAAIGAVFYARTRALGAACVVAALVVSHWPLDVLVHRPDLPLAPGGTALYGLSLWNSGAATVAVEVSLLMGAMVVYRRATRRLGAPRWPLAAYAALLGGVFLLTAFGPPPASPQAIAWAGQAQWVLVALAWWVDRAPARAALAAA